MTYNKKIDLTRWNRAGLSEFRYVDGNAITFLETLRLQLVEEFDQSGDPQWKELIERFPELPDESRLQANKRLSQQYYDDRRDYAWEIVRSFSRSAHVLGEYVNAYANEAYLSTAIEWDNIRKLVAMLDYRPSPPASAETYISLLYKENETGEVGKGFSVKNKPEAGESTVIFETQDKYDGSDVINLMHLRDWDKNTASLYKKSSTEKICFYLGESVEGINVGDYGVLAGESAGYPVEVLSVNNNETNSYIDLKILSSSTLINLPLYSVTLYLQPEFVSSPLANGENSALLYEDIGVSAEDVVFVDNASGWSARRVKQNELKHIRFADSTDNADIDKGIYRSRILRKQRHEKIAGGVSVFMLPEDFPAESEYFVDTEMNVISEGILDESPDGVLMRYISTGYNGDILYPDESSTGKIKQVKLNKIRFSGKAPEIETGRWAITHLGSVIEAYQVDNISIEEDLFNINLDGLSSNVSLLRSAFKMSLKHKDYNNNKGKSWSSESSDSVTVLQLNDSNVIDGLTLGQKLICSSPLQSFVVELKDISSTISGISQLHVSPAFHLDPLSESFTRNNTLIYGNAVRATHGETQPEKIVGNGDASKTNQCFELTSDTISWVSDASFSTGVRADLSLYVGQRQWQQVEDLSLSAAEDHHYQVEVNEDNMLSVCFGDGKHGRRLPTGVDNVRVSYRNGYGEDGNLAGGELVKIVRPHKLIEDFVAPLSSSGGSEKETSESMRESAPATVLALERAVSLDDFTHLAAHHSMVWQARAFEKMPDRPARSLIEVVVVAAGGSTFTAGSDTATLIQDYLVNHSVPGTPVSVISYSPLLMKLKLTIMVNDNAYDKKQVELAVATHLEESLTVKNRHLGQALFRSDIVALLEQVEGVENGHCEILSEPYSSLDVANSPGLHIGEDGMIRKVTILPFQLLYLDVDSYPLQIISQSYEI